MNFKRILESNQKYYKFYIEWNTGDMYWDNIPEAEYFYGTIEELEAYLSESEKAPDDFKELLLSADGWVYDEDGETWSAQIAEEISYEDCVKWKEEQEAQRQRAEEEKLRKNKEYEENYWHTEAEAAAAVQHLISASSISYADPTPKHSDRVSHFDDCGLYIEKDYTSDDRPYYAVFIRVNSPGSTFNKYLELRKPGPEAEIYKTWVDQLKRGPKERHETEASATWEYNYRQGKITKQNVNKFQPD